MINKHYSPLSNGLIKIKNLMCTVLLWLVCFQSFAQYITSYTATRTSVTYATLSGATQLCTGAAGCPDAVFTIALPWTFVFNGVGYTTAYMSQNGFITFGAAPAGTVYTPLSSAMAGVTGVIAAHGMNNAVTTATHLMRHKNNGTSYSFEWIRAGTGGALTGTHADYMITLFQTTNVIEIWYRTPSSYPENTNLAGQVGLRGSLTSEYKNLTTLTASPGYGGVNTATASWGVSNYTTVNNGKYTWTPPSFCTPPSIGATAFTYSNVVVNGTNSTANFSFDRGNGDGGVIAIVKAGSPPTAPANGIVYSGSNTAYGSGTAVGGGYLVYDAVGSGSGTINISLTALSNGVTYYVGIFEYNISSNCYVSSPLSGSIPIPICSPPSIQASGNSVSNIQTNQADINWTGNGNGDDVIVFIKQGSAIATDPTQTTNYNANAGFGLGDQIGSTGARAVYKGTGSSITVTGLTTNITYYYAIYARNSSTNCYTVPPITGSFTTVNSPMTTSAQVVTQVSVASVTPSSINNQILQLRMDCGTGTAPALVMGQLFFTTAATNGGTTNAFDIANAKVYYTGTSATFATTTQFGSTVVSPNGAFIVNGATTLVPGSNYFWLTYDIIGSPTIGDFVDAKLNTIDVGAIITPSGDPAGNRQITLTYCTPSPAFGGSSCSAAGNIYFTTAKLSGTTFYSGGTCGTNPYTNLSATVIANAVAGTAYTLQLISADATASYESDMYAWVDFNNNGLFTDPGENILNSGLILTGSALNTTSAPFTPASPGSFRMRVAVMSGGFGSIPAITPCAGQSLYYGEFKDFTLSVSASSTPMSYSSSTTTQNTTPVPPNNLNQQIVGVQVVTTGTLSPLSCTQLTFNTNGSSNISGDASNARVFYTGISAAFSTSTQFGSTVANPNGSHTVTGSVTLSPGINYFWIAYDVPSSATLGNNLDAECTSIIVGSTTYIPSVTAPLGVRPISLVYCVPSAGATGCSLGGDSWITAVSFNGTGSTFNFTGGTCLTPFPNNYQINSYTGGLNIGGTYTTTMVKGGSSSGARFIAWVDWNNDGDFTDVSEMIMDVTQTPASATGSSFTVPVLAAAGAHRLRTWVGYTGTIVSSDIASVTTGCEVLNGFSNQGEIRDFTILLAGGNIAPTITFCPGNVSVNNNAGLCNAVVNYSAATANGTPAPTITYSQNSGTSFPVGTTVVTVTASNGTLPDATCTFNVVVTDNENPIPTIASLPDISAECSANVTAPTAVDNCTGTITGITVDPTSYSTQGTFVIHWSYDDGNGNVVTQNQNVIIDDITNPVINNCPLDIITCNPVVSWTSPTSTDNCAAPSLSSNYTSGFIFPVGTTTVIYTADDGNGNTATCSFDVTINSSSVDPTSATSDAPFNEICSGSSTNLTVNGGSLGMGANWYWYSGSCNGTLVGTGVTINVAPTSNTTYFVKAVGLCNSTACVQITISVKTIPPFANVVVPPIINLPAYACFGTFVANINVPAVSGATQYIWDGPTGTTFNGSANPYTSATPSADITFGNPNGSGYYIGIQAANSCGVSVRKVQWVRGTVGVPASVNPSTAGFTTYCPNTSATFSCPPVTAATGYLWTITGNATVTPSGNSVIVNFGAGWTSGTLCVAAQTPCYTSPTKCLALSTTSATAYTPTGIFTVCPGTSQTYNVPADPSIASYIWTLPANASGSSSTNSINVGFLSTFTTGSICVQATTVCGVPLAQKCKSINSGSASRPASITGPTTGLCSQTVVYTCPFQSGATFTWTVPSNATINSGQGTNAISVTFGTFGTSTVCVTASNGCGPSASRCITVKGAPNAPGAITAIPSSWCANEAGIEFDVDISPLAGSYTLSWLYPNPSVAQYVLGGGNSTSLILNWFTGSGPVHVTASNACGNATRTSTQANSCRNDASFIGNNMLLVYPNPVQDLVFIEFNSKNNLQVNIILTDITGKIVMQKVMSANKGLNNQSLDVSNLSKGIYFLSVDDDSYSEKVKVAIQ